MDIQAALASVIAAMEVGTVNLAQRRHLHEAKLALELTSEPACRHEDAVYEDVQDGQVLLHDILICQICRAVLNAPELVAPAKPPWRTEVPI